ncbi:peptidoglycan-binding protein [Streptomyces tropicalis]|uniref:peptidoglycan-binding protein n=1 Tax=Streptomyces tropicalis TaxID=3034234 RepID=UPI003F68A50F
MAAAIAVAGAALAGFGGALLLPGRGGTADAAPARPPAAAAPASPSAAPAPSGGDVTGRADPDGPGTLRLGDTGPAVADLQDRLRHVPDIYRDGSTDGRYDAGVRAAVARFQLWYGITGDETGVYGNDTRRALESRTANAGSGEAGQGDDDRRGEQG